MRKLSPADYFFRYVIFLFCLACLGAVSTASQAEAAAKPGLQRLGLHKPGVIDSYAARIKSRVQRNLRVPRTAGGKTYVTTTRVDLDRHGNVLNVSITAPSGDRSFDSAVLRAISKTGSFGPPPFQHLRAVGLRFSSRF